MRTYSFLGNFGLKRNKFIRNSFDGVHTGMKTHQLLTHGFAKTGYKFFGGAMHLYTMARLFILPSKWQEKLFTDLWGIITLKTKPS